MHPGQPPGQYPNQYPPQQQYAQQPQQHYQQQQPQAPVPVPVNPKVQEALAQVDLLAGEQVIYTIQADGFFLGANPIAKMMAKIQAFFVTITGGHIRIFLIVTNQRLLVVQSFQLWCGCGKAKTINTIALAGVKEVGSKKETQACCIHTRTVQVQSMTQLYNLVIKQLGDTEIRQFVTNLSAVIVAHSNRSSV